MPPAHDDGADWPVRATKLPLGAEVQVDSPLVAVNEPAAHVEKSVAPSVETNWPGVAGVHADCAMAG